MSAEPRRDLELRRFTIDNLIVFSRIVGVSLLAIVTTIILARVLGREGNGSYALVVVFVTLLAGTFFNFGLPFANTYFTANRQYDLTTILSTNVALLCLLIPIAVTAGWGIIQYGSHLLLGDLPLEIAYLGLVIIPFYMIYNLLRNILIGLQDFRSMGLVDITQPLVTTLLLILSGIAGMITVRIALLALAVGYLASNILTLWLLRSKMNGWQDFFPRINLHYLRDLFAYGFKVYGNVIIATLLLRIDTVLIANLGGGSSSVGIYAIAVSIGERIWTLSGFTNLVLLPRIASWTGEDRKRDQLTLMTGKYTLWVSVFVVITLIVLGRWVISWMGDQYGASYDTMVALLPGIMMYNVARIFSSDIMGRGQRPGLVTVNVLIATAVNILLNLILIPRYDFIGAALASSIAYTFFGFGAVWLFFLGSNSRWVDLVLPTPDDIRRARSLFNLMRTYGQKVLSGRKTV